MRRTLTISLDEELYQELCRLAAGGEVSHFIQELIRRHLEVTSLKAQADSVREPEPLEWSGHNAAVGARPPRVLTEKARRALASAKPSKKALKRAAAAVKLPEVEGSEIGL